MLPINPIRPALPPISISKPIMPSIKGRTYKNMVTSCMGRKDVLKLALLCSTKAGKLSRRTAPCISISMPSPNLKICIGFIFCIFKSPNLQIRISLPSFSLTRTFHPSILLPKGSPYFLLPRAFPFWCSLLIF
jgi:hypothetical protein